MHIELRPTLITYRLWSCLCGAGGDYKVFMKLSHIVENLPSDMCAQRRLRSACASAQSDQSLRCSHEETLHTWVSNMRPVKILIRLRECVG